MGQIIIESAADVRAWAEKSGGLDSGDAQTFVDAVYLDDCPSYGTDWSGYLGRIDVAKTVLEGEVRFS
jgi:hypothetical protein